MIDELSGQARLPSDGADASIRRHVVTGSILVVVLAFGLGGRASTAEISSALIA